MPLGLSPPSYSLDGFKDTENNQKWQDLLYTWLPTFNPIEFLSRRINSEAPKGAAALSWCACVKALINLMGQMEAVQDNGNYQSSETYDQLHMIARCLPILLLRVPHTATQAAKSKIIIKNCNKLLCGSWRSLTIAAIRELNEMNSYAQNAKMSHSERSISTERNIEIILDKARSMHYSKAMNLLRSPGLSQEVAQTVLEQLKRLHPEEEAWWTDEELLKQGKEKPPEKPWISLMHWVQKQIRKSSAGTAVDQWNWDSKEM